MQAGDPGPSGAGDYDAEQQLDPTPASEIADAIGPQAERNATGGVAIRIVGAGVSARVVPFNRPTSQHHRMVSPITFAGRKPKQRAWIVDEWIPYGVVTALYGDGGLGKSLLAQQLQTCGAIGAYWLGLEVPNVRSIGFYCEDEGEELERRQIRNQRSARMLIFRP